MHTLTRSRYQEEVSRQAQVLVAIDNETDTEGVEAYDLRDDVLDGHPWFGREEYGAGLYGQIIEHSDTVLITEERKAIAEQADSTEETLKLMAYRIFSHDVWHRAEPKLRGETGD